MPIFVLARLNFEPGEGWQEFLGCSDEKQVVRIIRACLDTI
jgi:hypothetical protein